MKVNINNSKYAIAFFMLAMIAVILFALYSLDKIGADITGDVKKSIVFDQARFQISPQDSWDAPAKVTFRFAAARYMFFGEAVGGPSGQMQYPKVTGRFFCNKPFLPGYDYPTGLYETPDAIFEDGSPYTPTDVMDGHNGMSYSFLRSDAYEEDYNRFWQATVGSTYTTSCNYNQPGVYWPLFYADGISAWYTQKIVVTSSGVAPSVTATPAPSPSAVASDEVLYKAGFSVVGFTNAVQTDVFGKNGFTVFAFNTKAKTWDIISPPREYYFQANRAYYVYTEQDKSIKLLAGSSSTTAPSLSAGWNFIWSDSYNYLSSLYSNVLDSQGQCLAGNVSLSVLKRDDIIYKWIYNVVDGSALDSCSAFSLITGRDQPSSSCSDSHPLLNEVSYAKEKSGVWVYLWKDKAESWAAKNAYSCN